MDSLSDLLFGRVDGALEAAVVALALAGTLMMCVALALLARRHELGWWLAAGSYLLSGVAQLLNPPTLGMTTPMTLVLYAVAAAIPMVLGIGLGIYGLLSFQKFPLTAPLTRGITLRRFTPTALLAPLAVAAVFAVASLIPLLSLYATYGSRLQLGFGPVLIPLISSFLIGLLPGGLLGLAHRGRWAWFLIVVSALVSLGDAVLSAGGSVRMFLLIATIALAVYGWGQWKSLPAEKLSRS